MYCRLQLIYYLPFVRRIWAEAKLIKTRIEMSSIHVSHIPLTHNGLCAASGLICPNNTEKMKLEVMTLFELSTDSRCTRVLCN